MNAMTRHRKGWTIPEGITAAACALLGTGAVILGFTGIYITIVPLLEPWWHWFSPLYLGTGEGSFAFAYLGWLLLTMRDEPPRKLVAGLLAYLGFFAAASLALCAYASAGNFADVLSHVALCIAFFGAGIIAKVLVHRLAADPVRRRTERALADARRYAIDLLRARLGLAWRFRAPSLLRRQVTTGRLCDAVREDVTAKVDEGRTSGWEGAVREWVLGADGLNLAAQAAEDARRAHASITRQAPPAPPAATLPEVPASVPPKAITGASPKPSVTAVQRVRRLGGRKATDEDILEAIRELFAAGSAVTKYRVVKELKGPHGGIAEPRAGKLLAQVQAEHPRPSLHLAAKAGG